jgi:hypothetical protein
MKQGVTRKKVLAYMRKEPNAKPKEVAKAVGVGISCVYNIKHQIKKELLANQRVLEAKLNLPKNLKDAFDVVNHPPHYKVGGIEVIDFIESKGLTYNLGNVVKYVSRADHKGNRLEDLRKAQWYLNREIFNLEKLK